MRNWSAIGGFAFVAFILIVSFQNFDSPRGYRASGNNLILNLPDNIEGDPKNYVSPSIRPSPSATSNACEMNFNAVSDRKYRYGTFTCHQFANAFCEANGEAVVVQCGQDVSGYGGHTINLGPDPNNRESGVCLVEPQSGRTCCFHQENYRDTCGNYNVNLRSGAGKDCADKLCIGQYKPEHCRPLPPFARAGTVQFRYAECISDATSHRGCMDCLRKVTEERMILVADWLESEPQQCKEDLEDLSLEESKYHRQCPAPRPTPKPRPTPSPRKPYFPWK